MNNVIPFENDLIKGLKKSKEDLCTDLIWKGTKMPWGVWCKSISFMKYSYEKVKSETLISYLYNPTKKEWAVFPFEQITSGMTVKYNYTNPEFKKQKAQFPGYLEMGTLHNHCCSKAFQSGTDKSDEEGKDGIHLTVGELDDKWPDIHIRGYYKGLEHTVNLSDWVDLPKALLEDVNPELPEEYLEEAIWLSWRKAKEKDFPKGWMKNISKPKVTAYSYKGIYPDITETRQPWHPLPKKTDSGDLYYHIGDSAYPKQIEALRKDIREKMEEGWDALMEEDEKFIFENIGIQNPNSKFPGMKWDDELEQFVKRKPNKTEEYLRILQKQIQNKCDSTPFNQTELKLETPKKPSKHYDYGDWD